MYTFHARKIILLIFILGTELSYGAIPFPKPTPGSQSFSRPLEVLKIVAPYLPKNPIIFEAGAYDGGDTVKMLNFFPHATIYAFEPIPYLYDKLHRNARMNQRQIKTFKLAISDSTGTANMFVSEEERAPGIPSMSSSLMEPKEHLTYSDTLFKKTITVETITMDEWARKHNVNRIDFMWLDMQGYELHALKASPKIFATVKAILTEVEFVEAYEGQYLFEDVKKYLESNGFTMVADNFAATKNFFGDALFVRKN